MWTGGMLVRDVVVARADDANAGSLGLTTAKLGRDAMIL